MHVSILGPLVVQDKSRDITPSAAKPRQMFALLALSSGRTVSMGSLLEELWEDSPPRSARTTLHTYVLQLRRMLYSAALHDGDPLDVKRILETSHGGYRLHLSRDQLDLHRFEDLLRGGMTLYNNSEFDQAALSLTQALAVWRGPVLTGMDAGPQLRAETARLEALRLVALEKRLRADLSCGRHEHILGELSGLVVRFHMHENYYELLMIALYRSGRRLQALDVFRRLRREMREEVGLEPNGTIQRLQQAILAEDPVLDLGTPVSSLA